MSVVVAAGPIAPPVAKAPRRQGISDGLTGFASAARAG